MFDDSFCLVITKRPISFKALSWALTSWFPSSHKYLLFLPFCPITRPIQPAPSTVGSLSTGMTISTTLNLPALGCGPTPAPQEELSPDTVLWASLEPTATGEYEALKSHHLSANLFPGWGEGGGGPPCCPGLNPNWVRSLGSSLLDLNACL